MAEIRTVVNVTGDLKDAAQKLLDAAMEYWKVYQKSSGGSAVVWLEDDAGRLVMLTRGEYKRQLMANIPDQAEPGFF